MASNTSRISTGINTRDRLLDKAEELFARDGFAATSMRELTTQAGTNLAAVNYHFKSKEGLIRALLVRRFGPLNEERIRLLDMAERAAAPGLPTLDSVLEAFVAPTIRMCRQYPDFMRLMGKMQSDPPAEIREWMSSDLFSPLVIRLEALLTRILPRAPIEELYWRMIFLVGAMCQTWMSLQDMEVLSRGQVRFDNDDALIRRLVSFAAAGIRAGSPADNAQPMSQPVTSTQPLPGPMVGTGQGPHLPSMPSSMPSMAMVRLNGN
jgi:AcrR family transcriptional regulator